MKVLWLVPVLELIEASCLEDRFEIFDVVGKVEVAFFIWISLRNWLALLLEKTLLGECLESEAKRVLSASPNSEGSSTAWLEHTVSLLDLRSGVRDEHKAEVGDISCKPLVWIW